MRTEKLRAVISIICIATLQAGAATLDIAGSVVSRTNPNASLQQQTEEMQRLREESARLYREGKYDEAIPVVERMIRISEKSQGLSHPDTIIMLNSLATLYSENGDYTKAESLFIRVLDITEKAHGPEHKDTVRAINNLAALYEREGDYTKAESLYERALQIREKTPGPMHPNTSTSLQNLASMYGGRADYAEAERLYIRALNINEKTLGPKHLNTAILLSNLGVLYFEKGDYAKAEPLHVRALKIYEELFGPKDLYTAAGLNNLAALYQAKGDYVKAESFYKRDLEIVEELAGPNDLDTATPLSNLATLYQTKGDYAKAEPLYLRTLKITEQKLGPDHPLTGSALTNLTTLYYLKGDVSKTLAFLSRELQVVEVDFRRNLTIGSERQVINGLKTSVHIKDLGISLHVRQAPQLAAARDLAFASLIHFKGRNLDAITDSLAALRRRASPEDLSLFDKLAQARTLLAAATLRGQGNADLAQYRASLKAREDEVEKIEIELSRRSAEFRQQIAPVTLDAVRKAITPGLALVEFASYTPFNPSFFTPFDPSIKVEGRKPDNSRYVAYVLNNQGEIKWVDLGEAAPIDEAVNRLRAVLRKEANKPLSDIDRETKPRARELDRLVMEPIRKLLGNTRRLLVAPDGALNLVPFQALVDENNRYLVESYSISYLTTGRDLLKLQNHVPGTQEIMIFANPNFGGDMSSCSDRKVSVVSNAVNFSQLVFCPLPATAEEANALKKVFPVAKTLIQEQATESTLKRVAGPKILHIATHGFFFEDFVMNNTSEGRGSFSRERRGQSAAPQRNRVGNPLLRSGLVMAGANRPGSADDDGLLTALEVSGLNLWGTKLVVLSACDTGLGEVKNGEGVYGLRRALVLAGSETQVMSLWQVDDEGTRDLMIEYYKALQAGQGRSEALRNVQLQMLTVANRRHPYYWASFIQSGEWANLDDKR